MLRFVDDPNVIREEFIDFILGTTSNTIANKILKALERYGLNVSNLRGQACDGTGNMAGRYIGAAAIIQRTCSKAVYVHCAAHTLNLCAVDACKLQMVKTMIGAMVEVCLFFTNSPKLQLELEKHIKSIEGTCALKLGRLCKTRWVARIDAIEVFFYLYLAVVRTLEVISEGSTSRWNTESCRSAENLIVCIKKFHFLMSFIVTKQCLGYTKGLTIFLQKKAKDICQAYSEVNSIVTALSEVCLAIDVKHKEWLDTAVVLGQKVDTYPSQLPRHCSMQTAGNYAPGDTPKIYYKRTISIPFLEELISHLNSRFSNIQQVSPLCIE